MTTTPTTPSELLPDPCPFCGWEAPRLVKAVFSMANGYHELVDSPYVRCEECGAIGPQDDDGDDAAAVALWNRRGPFTGPTPVTPTPSELIVIKREDVRALAGQVIGICVPSAGTGTVWGVIQDRIEAAIIAAGRST